MTEKPTRVTWMGGGKCFHRPAVKGFNWVRGGCRWAGMGTSGTHAEAEARGLRACGLCYHELYLEDMHEWAMGRMEQLEAEAL